MPAPGTAFDGPLISGPRRDANNNGPANTGLVELTQTLTLTQNSTADVSGTFTIPEHCQITEFLIDAQIVWNSAVSAGLTIGTAALGTQYMSSLNMLVGGTPVGRVRVPAAGGGTPAPTAAQLLAMKDTGTNKSVVATVAVAAGATSTGTTIITMRYIQTKAWMSP